MNWDDPAQRYALIDRVGPAEYNRLMQQHLEDSVLETVAGHAIRPVGSRFGRLFMVGGTGTAFRTLDEARKFATDNPAP